MCMEEKLKQLLLKDLSARLPYGVELLACDVVVGKLAGIVPYAGEIYLYLRGVLTPYRLDEVKPYLRSMDDMTDDEKHEYNTIAMHTIVTSKGFVHTSATDLIDWLNVHHFDFRNLIECGLAIAVTEENSPY